VVIAVCWGVVCQRSGSSRVLITTDLHARGIHVQQVRFASLLLLFSSGWCLVQLQVVLLHAL
jgi:hypothetical protein